MSNSFSGLGFIIDMVLSFVILAFTLRIFLALFSANTQNPVTQSIIKITSPIKALFFLPNIGKFELSSFLIISGYLSSLCFFTNYLVKHLIN